MSKKQHILSAKMNFLVDYATNQFAEANGLHLNSNDWKPYIRISPVLLFDFIRHGHIEFKTRTTLSKKSYSQIIKMTEHKKIESTLIILFLLKLQDKDVINFISEFLMTSNAKLRCVCPAFCLDKDTIIPTLDGKTDTIETLLERSDNGEDLYISSIDDNGEYLVNKVIDVWISGHVKKMIKITLNNDKYVITTPEHKYMLKDGSYKEAKELVVDEYLFNYKVKNIEDIKYVTEQPVYDIAVEKYHNFYTAAGAICANSFWGPAYNLTTMKNTIYGPAENRPPDTRDAKRNNLVCKHLWVVLLSFKRNINFFAKEILPYYKRKLGANSDKALDKLAKKMSDTNIKLLVQQSSSILSGIDDKLFDLFIELTKDKLNTLLEVNDSISTNETNAKNKSKEIQTDINNTKIINELNDMNE